VTLRETLVVSDDEAGVRLDDYLAARFGTLSRMKIRQAVLNGLCRVNGEPAASGDRLSAADRVEVELDPSAPNAMQPEEIPIEIPYEDDWLAVVNKPAGMLVHPTRGVKSGTLANALAWHWNRNAAPSEVVRPVFVNRLDKPTSGLVVVAKSEGLQLTIEKRYLALVAGAVEQDQTIEAPIARISEERPHWQVSPNGKASTSRLRVIERGTKMTLVELSPLTGRTNQLRIHCAHIGHPIFGDREFGGPDADRLCLHASHIRFKHPKTGVIIEVHADLPTEIHKIWTG
jgi:23S rRNA pseudouridine1911/1915/1917 synthase